MEKHTRKIINLDILLCVSAQFWFLSLRFSKKAGSFHCMNESACVPQDSVGGCEEEEEGDMIIFDKSAQEQNIQWEARGGKRVRCR